MADNKMPIQRVIDGLQIFSYYPNAYICAEHDEILACASGLIPEDAKKLEALGWRLDDAEAHSWKKFV